MKSLIAFMHMLLFHTACWGQDRTRSRDKINTGRNLEIPDGYLLCYQTLLKLNANFKHLSLFQWC